MISSLGLEPGVVRLVEYDPQWPVFFQEEAQRISLAVSRFVPGRIQASRRARDPGRDFFRRGTPRAYHLHLAKTGSDLWHEHLAFRNLLRLDPVLRERYASLKRRLAMQYPRDRGSYIDAKGPFIRETLALIK